MTGKHVCLSLSISAPAKQRNEYEFFNTDGSPDSFVNPSLDQDDFQEYVFSAGVTDDGIGDPLDEFISFSIKIVMQGTNMSQPPRIKDLRAIALAT